MFFNKKRKTLKEINYFKIKELISISFSLGVNLTSPTVFKEWLRVVNVMLVIFSGCSLYGHWSYTRRYIGELTEVLESVCTALQTIISIIKMVYLLFIQRMLQELLRQAQSHEIITKSKIFRNDYFTAKKLKELTHDIMEKNWNNIRGQLIFYICACATICSHYVFMALFVNTYHAMKKTPNYKHVLPFPSIYPVWENKGMSFPYYHIQMFLGSCAVYIAGVAAICFDGVFIVLCVHGVGLCQVLHVLIRNSTSPDIPKGKRVEYLRSCIILYQRIYEYVLTLRTIYRQISLPQFLLSLIIWGIVIFQMNVGLESDKMTFIRMMLYLCAAGYEIVIYCFNSQRLTNEYEQIPIALYSCEWYNECPEFKQLVRMMILRSNRAFELKISWFASMTLATFLAMVKTSGSYYLLLKNLTE